MGRVYVDDGQSSRSTFAHPVRGFYPILQMLKDPADLRNADVQKLEVLADEIREFLINELSVRTSMHFSANLGVVELTLALFHALDLPKDKLIWDVGHQCYPHKILTGRMEAFEGLRSKGGMSGFPSMEESEYDAFGTGHAGTSISAALGYALSGEEGQSVCVIGDASLASGMALEALNHLGECKANVLVVLNDNGMSIDRGVGALDIGRDEGSYHKLMQSFSIPYAGPVDGHNMEILAGAVKGALSVPGPKVLHVRTVKGKGYGPAEQGEPAVWHAPGRFDAQTGKREVPHGVQPPKFQEVYGESLHELASQNANLFGVTPAMVAGASMQKVMLDFPNRFFDVGIAEQHAVTLSAGLSAAGRTVFCHIYSTFLQRGYDQLLHDVAIQNLPVAFFLDRAGFVGGDGVTHHGVFDISFCRAVPGLIVAAPMDVEELRDMMYTASQGLNAPIAVRFPRGKAVMTEWRTPFKTLETGKGRVISESGDIAILSYGTIGSEVLAAREILKAEGVEVAHYDMRFAKPLDEALLDKARGSHRALITIEEGTVLGGFGDAVLEYVNGKGPTCPIHVMGIPDQFFKHGSQQELRAQAGIDSSAIVAKVQQVLGLL